MCLSGLDVHACLFKLPTKHHRGCNGENQEEKHEHNQSVFQQRHGFNHRQNQVSQTFNACDGSQRPEHTEGSEWSEVETFFGSVCVQVYLYFRICFWFHLYDREVGWPNNNEVENIPHWAEVSSLVQDETQPQNFDYHFSTVKPQENILDDLLSKRFLYLQGVFLGQGEWIRQDDTDAEVFEKLVAHNVECRQVYKNSNLH